MKNLTPLVLLCAAQTSYAGCSSENTVFSCTVASGKRVEICKSGKTLTYAFGRNLAQPELKLVKPYGQAFAEPWHGVGPDAYGVEIPNGDTSYHAFVRPVSSRHGMEVQAGIRVAQKRREVELICNDEGVVNNMEGLDLPERE